MLDRLGHHRARAEGADRLNPGTPEAVLFGLPRSTPARVRADLPALSRDVRERLDSRAPDDYKRYFTGSDEGRSPPSRAGYALGHLVAKEVAGGRDLPALARLTGPALREEIDRALARSADSKPSPSR